MREIRSQFESAGEGASGVGNTGAIGILRIKFVPEPASWLMLAAGIGFLGLLYRRRARELRLD
jgi:hypothetical protein